jgi:hypothetical protein
VLSLLTDRCESESDKRSDMPKPDRIGALCPSDFYVVTSQPYLRVSGLQYHGRNRADSLETFLVVK